MFEPYLEKGRNRSFDFEALNNDFKDIFRDLLDQRDLYRSSADQQNHSLSDWNSDSRENTDNIQDAVNSLEQAGRENYETHSDSSSQSSQDVLDQDMTRDEFAQVKEVLEKNDFSEEKIESLEKRFEEDGLTWEELGQELGIEEGMVRFKELIQKQVSAESKSEIEDEKNIKQGEIDKIQSFLEDNGFDFLNREISEKDFKDIKKLLLGNGFSQEEVKALQEKFDKDGLTWKDLLAELKLDKVFPGADLDVQDKQNLLDFFTSMGFNSRESQKLVGLLEGGRQGKFWQEMASKLATMPDDQKITITRPQAESLFKALGISQAKMEKFSSFLSGEQGKNDLKQFLDMLKKESMEAGIKSNLAQLLKQGGNEGKASENRSLLTEIVKMARNSTNESEQSARESSARTRSASIQNFTEGAAQEGKAGNSRDGNDSRNNSGQSQNDRLNTHQDNARKGGQESAGQNTEGKSRENSWETLLNRISSSDKGEGKAEAFGEARAAQSAEAARQKAAVQQKEFISRQILEQIQNGMFKKLNNGRHQLTLQLDPPSLGRIGVILQVQDKEVRALIRPSSSEVAQVVQENMARLKASLEQQGLRVSKIEVQTQTHENHGQAWQGQEEHNESRERMRQAVNAARVRGMNMESSSGLERDGAVMMNAEGSSGPGLDIFA
ncbi:MAG: flagellar hook-length control protein FliK [Desulfonatronovibrionaceae bacterium]